MDRSNGYESVAAKFLAGRGQPGTKSIGASTVLAWGLIFLLPSDTQRELIPKVAAALVPGGRFLFTSPPEAITWNDAMTGLGSRSLGAAEYRHLLSASGLTVKDEYEDVGENHYYDTIK